MFSSRTKFLIIIIFLFIILVGGFILWKIPKTPKEITLNFWGVFDDSSTYGALISKFEQQYPWIKINYKKFTYDEYEKTLLKAWASGQGPDIFLIHNTWLPKYQSQIYPYPQTAKTPLNTSVYQRVFMPVASQDFIRNGQIYAIPFYVDSLALYYNEGVLQDLYHKNPDDAWILNPPKTWTDFIKTVKYVTQKDAWGNLGRAGAALGTANNVNRASDILALIMLQSGTQMVSDDLKSVAFNKTTVLNGAAYNPGERSLEFYTDFANPRKKVYTWNVQRNYSIDEFSEGKVVMTFGYSYLMNIIKKKNPNLDFKVASMPQIKEAKTPVNYANYWATTVSRFSHHPKEAWNFLEFASRPENVWLYLAASHRPTARMDMISYQEKQMPDLAIFAHQGVTAQSWYQIDDNAIEKIFLNMIENVNYNRTSPADAINEAAQEINLLMSPPAPPPGELKPPEGINLFKR